jgi:hypothetical protein
MGLGGWLGGILMGWVVSLLLLSYWFFGCSDYFVKESSFSRDW